MTGQADTSVLSGATVVGPEQAEQQFVAGLAPDGYRLLGVLGRGGSATVYHAHQDEFDRDVALKVLDIHAPGPRDLARFQRECKALGRLASHPNIVDIFDAGTTPAGQPYLAMTLCRTSLADQVAADGPLPVTTLAAHLVRIADALQYAHDNGIVHRDVKPQNILVSQRGVPILTDFGVALVEQSEQQTLTAAFTYQHVAPEVLAGAPATARSDIYSLGSSAYAMLSGRPPFVSDTITGLIEAILEREPEPLRGPGMEQCWPIIAQALAKDPGARQRTAGEFADQLRNLLPDLPHRVLIASGPRPRAVARVAIAVLGAGAVALAAAAPALVAPQQRAPVQLLTPATTTGTPSAGAATAGVMSMDGKVLGFSSAAPLIPDVPQGAIGAYTRELATGYVALASRDAAGRPSRGDHAVAAIAPTGAVLLQEQGRRGQLVLHPPAAAAPTTVSVDSRGTTAQGRIWNAVVSPNGQFVAFQSDATNLVDYDANGQRPTIFIHDTATRQTFVANTDDFGRQCWGRGPMHIAGFSADSGQLFFDSFADGLVTDDRNGSRDVFSRDFANRGVTTILSAAADGRPAPRGSDTRIVGLSPRGRSDMVVLASEGVSFDGTGSPQRSALYTRDLWSREITRRTPLPAAPADVDVAVSPSGQRAAIAVAADSDRADAWSVAWLESVDAATPLPEVLDGTNVEAVGFGDNRSLIVATSTSLLERDADNVDDIYRIDVP